MIVAIALVLAVPCVAAWRRLVRTLVARPIWRWQRWRYARLCVRGLAEHRAEVAALRARRAVERAELDAAVRMGGYAPHANGDA